MDRNRLKEVHQSDLAESRINEDFLQWLKNKAPTYLLILLVGLCTYVLFGRYRASQEVYTSNAWSEYINAQLPGSLEEIAEKYDDVGAIQHLARNKAAEQLLNAVQLNQELGTIEEADRIELTPELRLKYLDRAGGLYQQIIDADPDQSPQMILLTLNALFGQAAIAESKGEIDSARALYDQVASRAESHFEHIVQQAHKRQDNLVAIASAEIVLPENPLNTSNQDFSNLRKPLFIDPAFNDLISPDAAGGALGSGG